MLTLVGVLVIAVAAVTLVLREAGLGAQDATPRPVSPSAREVPVDARTSPWRRLRAVIGLAVWIGLLGFAVALAVSVGALVVGAFLDRALVA